MGHATQRDIFLKVMTITSSSIYRQMPLRLATLMASPPSSGQVIAGQSGQFPAPTRREDTAPPLWNAAIRAAKLGKAPGVADQYEEEGDTIALPRLAPRRPP